MVLRSSSIVHVSCISERKLVNKETLLFYRRETIVYKQRRERSISTRERQFQKVYSQEIEKTIDEKQAFTAHNRSSSTKTKIIKEKLIKPKPMKIHLTKQKRGVVNL